MDRGDLETATPDTGPASGEDARGQDRPSDAAELLLWSLMERFERLALERYTAHAPELATAAKRDFVGRLAALELDAGALAASELAAPVDVLLDRARSGDQAAALIVQGLVLEHVGQAIYRVAETSDRAGPASRALAAIGRSASLSVTERASARIASRSTSPEALYAEFADRSYDVLAALDALAEPVDRVFGARFGLRFADVMGEFTADLVAACTALGMQRRKVVAHLAGACMGI